MKLYNLLAFCGLVILNINMPKVIIFQNRCDIRYIPFFQEIIVEHFNLALAVTESQLKKSKQLIRTPSLAHRFVVALYSHHRLNNNKFIITKSMTVTVFCSDVLMWWNMIRNFAFVYITLGEDVVCYLLKPSKLSRVDIHFNLRMFWSWLWKSFNPRTSASTNVGLWHFKPKVVISAL